jgi:hypothetical protein
VTKAKVKSTVKAKAKKRLPSKISELIVLAVKDCKAVEKDKRYELNMGVFHAPSVNGKCHVCMAGAVMAKSLGTAIDQVAAPNLYSNKVQNQLNTLDSIRMGHLWTLNTQVPERVAVHVNGYIRKAYKAKLGRAPWPVYLKAARILAEAGL